jgi:hypothetical protein
VDIDTPLGDILAVPRYAAVLQPVIDMAMRAMFPAEGAAGIMPAEALAAMLKEMPLRGIEMFAGDMVQPGMIEGLAAQLKMMG